MPELVLPEHRPTLRDLLPPVPPAAWRALAAVAALVAIAVGWLVLRPEDDGGIDYVHRGSIEFNFHHPPELRRVAPSQGEYVRLERRRDGLFLDSFAVAPLSVPAYRGDVSGILPVAADAEIARLERRFAAFELVEERKTRINDVAGYAIVFRARLGERRLYGRAVLLPEAVPGARRGALLMLLATPASGVPQAQDVGVHGAIKLPYRSFRFGTKKP